MTQVSEEFLREATANNTSFSQEVPGLQLAWDSVALGLLKECPYKYFLTQICGYQGGSDHLTFGIVYHECQEVFKLALVSGHPFDEALRKAVFHALITTGEYQTQWACTECGATAPGDDLPNCPECAAPIPWAEETASKWVPWESDIPEKTRFTLVRTIVWWADMLHERGILEDFKTKKLKDGRPAVEIPFQFDSGVENKLTSEGNYIFCGRLDEIVDHLNLTFTKDAKTTKYTLSPDYFEKFSPDNQMSLYTLAGRVCLGEPVDGVMIDAAQVTQNFSRFGQGFAERTPGLLDEWMRDQEYWLRLNEQFVRDRYWPRNDTSCSKYGGCPFSKRRLGGVCRKDPAVRQPFLNTHFHRRMWDPLQRGQSHANPNSKS